MKVALRMTVVAVLLVGLIGGAFRLAAEDASTSKPSAATEAKTPPKSVAEEIGSLRNAKVAIAVPADKKIELTYFGSLTEAEKAELSKLAPNVKVVGGLSAAEALARAEEAHGIDAKFANPEFLARAKNLVWVQATSAGVDRYIEIESLVKNDAIVLTNFRAVHGPSIADHAMAMLLSVTRDLRRYTTDDATRAKSQGKIAGPTALDGKTILVVGIGGIGTEIAQRAHGFGMRVIGTRRSTTPSPSFIEKVGQPQDLLKMLPEADVVAIAVPLTPETVGMFNAEAFSAMKRGAYLINIARGKIVETDALVEALKSGKLAGACLDVTEPEPLPAQHPLRLFSNVIITPHVAGQSEVTDQRRSALLVEQLRRFGTGEPLYNVVDKKAGY